MSNIEGNSIFWIEVDKIHPNPYQPRKEFDQVALQSLADSIRMYGVLQPLVVTRKEVTKPDGGLAVEYELISGERRTRAARLAGIREIPAIIRNDADDGRIKLELAIIENLQREDLNAADRARGFERLYKEFKMTHQQIADRVGKSREYVSNTLRILLLPEEIIQALGEGKITDGHTRPLLMLADKPAEQNVLFKEIILHRMTVREAEATARKVSVERVRKASLMQNPEITELENKVAETLGTRVVIEHKKEGGRIHIAFFGEEDLRHLLEVIANKTAPVDVTAKILPPTDNPIDGSQAPADDRTKEEKKEDENDLYSLKNFSV